MYQKLNKSLSGWERLFYKGLLLFVRTGRKFWWTERAGDDQTGHPSRIGVILPEAVLMDAIQWRTDRSDRPVRTNGKRPNYQSPYVLTHTSRRLRLSSLCAYYFFARKSFSEPGWIRQSTRHLEWQKTVNWSTWVPIAFWNFLTYAKYFSPFKYWGLPHSSPLLEVQRSP